MVTVPASLQLEPMALVPLAERPLVSVLIANYNYEGYIGQTLESALAQTYSSFEIVICDDGSTDKSVEVIDAYCRRDGRIRLVQQANAGHGPALNHAFAACHGDVICLLDSDDLFLPRKLERVVCQFQNQPAAGIALHRVIRVNETRRAQGVWPLYGELPEGWRGEQLLQSGGVLPYLPPTSGLSFRREVAERLFPLPTGQPLGGCPDQVLMRLAPLIASVTKLDEPLAEYRVHRANTYTKSRLTLETVSREIELGERLWEAQYTFLFHLSPECASRFLPLDRSGYVLLLKYVRSKLSDDGTATRAYSRFIADVSKQADARYLWFWRSTRFLPRAVFAFAVNLLMSQNALKQFLARLKGLI